MTITVKTVSVSYGRKQNLGDFNSANIECTIWADMTGDEDLDTAMCALWEMAKNNVKAQLLPLVERGATRTERIFMGLPLELQKVIAKGDE